MMIIGQWGIIRILRGRIDRMMMTIACALMLPLLNFSGYRRSCSSHLIAAATAVNAATAVAAAAACAKDGHCCGNSGCCSRGRCRVNRDIF